jgi:hypothetical protein
VPVPNSLFLLGVLLTTLVFAILFRFVVEQEEIDVTSGIGMNSYVPHFLGLGDFCQLRPVVNGAGEY